MKLIKQEISKEEFKPFKITIEIETEDDLRNLWHRFNVNRIKYYEDFYNDETFGTVSGPANWEIGKQEIWKKLDQMTKRYGLKHKE